MPDSTDDPALVSDTEDSDEEDTGILPNHLVENDATEWYTPPPPIKSVPPILVVEPPVDTLPSTSTSHADGSLFKLGMSLSFYDGRGNSEIVVYKGVMPDGLIQIVCWEDGTHLQVHNTHLCLKLQASLSNIPKTSLDYYKEVSKGIYLKGGG